MDKKYLTELASEIAHPQTGVEIKKRKYLLKSYNNCFIGSDLVSWIAARENCSKPAATALGNQLIKAGLIYHVVDSSKPLIDGHFFYRLDSSVKHKRIKLKKNKTVEVLEDILLLALDPLKGVTVKDRKYHFKKYSQCFVASEFVDWMIQNISVRNRDEAEVMGNKLVDKGFIEHVCDPQGFKDSYLFFRFSRLSHSVYKKMNKKASSNNTNNNNNDDNNNDDNIECLDGNFDEVTADDFEQISLLGEGGYGKVILVRKKDSGEIYAMKSMDKNRIKTQKALEHIITEKQVLINDSPFLLHLHYSFQTQNKLFMVTDFLSGGDMFFHLSNRQGNGFPVKACKFFIAEITLAIEHLHQAGIIYRDLKLENVLLDNIGHICLADFGLSKELDETDTTKTFCGSQGYLAPEILKAEPYSYNVDWFSLGVIFYEMISGSNPFLGADFHETCRNILHKEPVYPGNIFPKNVADLLVKLLDKNPQTRITSASEIKRQPFFKGMDWHKLSFKKTKPPFKINVSNSVDTSNFDDIFTRMSISEFDINSEFDNSGSGSEIIEDFSYTQPSVLRVDSGTDISFEDF
eukprot:TRINITY_DN1043_c2_g1_i1.p1 TRINITY_DN1043_c2_g1~~TRINITY_DN1043_c2_g1_i1.p1  ORF type:complete len:576 (+),score=173.27 TRINITY_DN1043_c2_g1_i1:60-1787(+)